MKPKNKFQILKRICLLMLAQLICLPLLANEIIKESTFKGENLINLNEKLISTSKVMIDRGIEVQYQVSGVVTDESGLPLPGASIVEKGTSNGVSTDFDGNFSISLANNEAILVVSYVGYTTQETSVSNSQALTIQLSEDAAALDEVVVVGYGSQSKRKVTGAVASIKASDFQDIPVASVEEGFAAQLPGVQVAQSSGRPGQSSNINIRGTGTVTAGTQPLIVLDGIPLSDDATLSSINPNNIASIEVLKDAASAAIYGSRGANGVILVSTKTGKSSEPQYNFNTYVGIQTVAKKLDLMNAYEHAIWSRDARNNYYLKFDNGSFSINDDNATREANASTLGFNPRKAILPSYIQPYLNGESNLTDVDWQDELFREALMQNYQFSVSGLNEGLSYYISTDYFKQDGIVLGTDYERFNTRVNLRKELSSKIKLGLNLAPSLIQESLIQSGFNSSPINSVMMALPYFPVRNADGSLAIGEQVVGAIEGDQARSENPVALATLIDDKQRTFGLQGGTFLEYKMLDALTFKTSLGIELTSTRRDVFDPSNVGSRNRPTPDIPSAISSNSDRTNWITESTLNYNTLFNDKHSVDFLVGYSFQEDANSSSLVTATDFPNNSVETINAGIVNGGTGFKSKSTLVSYLARARYDFMGKYLLSAAIRRDGSSRFGSKTKFGNFPSVSLGYRISEEDFFPQESVINELKLRGSWGVTGNNQVGDFAAQALLESANAIINGTNTAGVAVKSAPNPNLGWEETRTIDIGLDMGLFNNRLTASFDYYKANTTDVLLDVPVPAHSGFTTSLQNIGEVQNTGFEFAIKGNYNLGAVKATTAFNISTNKNEVVALGPGQEEIISGRNITRIGDELGASYGYKTDGVFTSQEQIDSMPSLSNAQVGEYIYVDSNGDGKITSADRVNLGSVHPDYTYGINQSFEYKNIDLGIVIQGVEGVHVHDRTLSVLLYNPEGWGNGSKDYFDNYYTPERGGNSIYARPNTVPTDNGFYRETDVLQDDASFVRIRNITLGYTLPNEITKKLNMSKLRLYFSSKNPFTWTDYRGYNPEQRSGNTLAPTTGFDAYPVSKSFVFGMNLTF